MQEEDECFTIYVYMKGGDYMKMFAKFQGVLFVTILLQSAIPSAYAAQKEAHMTGATVTTVTSPSLTVMYKNKTFIVNTDASTKIVRRFGALSSINQVSSGDIINVSGTWTDTGKTTVHATLIRDGSIQEKHDTFVGTVSVLTSNGFVLQSRQRGHLSVTTGSATKIVDRKGQTIALSHIAVTDTVRVDGLFDRTLKTISATTIKDSSQPARQLHPTISK